MKAEIKKAAAATAVFTCSLFFCLLVLMQGGGAGVMQEGGETAGKNTALTAAEEQARPVLVIDAGHGGQDGGAAAADGTPEKDINLAIALKLKEIAAQYPVDVVMTREEDVSLHTDEEAAVRTQKRQDLLKRKEIIAAADAELAVSIHLNSFPEDKSVYGAQVFFPRDELVRTGGRTYEHSAQEYAESIQKSLEMNIEDGRERSVAAKGDVLLLTEPICPIVLVEGGFLSNEQESKKLKTGEYQEKLALAIWEGINELWGLEKSAPAPVVESANKRA